LIFNALTGQGIEKPNDHASQIHIHKSNKWKQMGHLNNALIAVADYSVISGKRMTRNCLKTGIYDSGCGFSAFCATFSRT